MPQCIAAKAGLTTLMISVSTPRHATPTGLMRQAFLVVGAFYAARAVDDPGLIRAAGTGHHPWHKSNHPLLSASDAEM